jgi:N-carbamoylputrescine amidase
MAFTVACAQFAPAKADTGRNLDTIAEVARQAQGEGAELVVFPETATSGYFLEGGVLECAVGADAVRDELARRLEGLDRPLDLLVGHYETAGGNLYNAATYLEFSPEGARRVRTYRKFFLPTYGVFDEERFVSRGRDLAVFDTRLGRFGVLICEDVWHGILPTLCAVAGAQAILVPAASPARGFSGTDGGIENHERYRRLFRAIGEEHGLYCVNAQLCGFEGGKGFVGGSMVVDPFGRVVAEGPINEPHLLLAEVDFDLLPIARAQSPLISDLQSAWSDIQRLVANTEFSVPSGGGQGEDTT